MRTTADMGGKGKGIAVFPVTERGLELAERLSGRPGVVVHAPMKLRRGGLKRLVKEAFEERAALLFISASGIAVRSVAPYIKGKGTDPAVIVMDEGARFVVSLLSGHLGGANRLAREIAAFFKATPVITTATDVAGLPCVEDIAERFSFVVEDARRIKRVNAAVLRGEKVLVVDPDARRRKRAKALFGDAFSFGARVPSRRGGYSAFVIISSLKSVDAPEEILKKALVLRPREFAIGVGCRRGVSAREISIAVKKAMEEAGISLFSIRNIATIDIKKDETGLTGFAAKAGLGMEYFSATELNRVRPPSGRSRTVEEKTGAAGVSEPAALLSSGAKRLWLKKRVYGRVTVAAARVR